MGTSMLENCSCQSVSWKSELCSGDKPAFHIEDENESFENTQNPVFVVLVQS